MDWKEVCIFFFFSSRRRHTRFDCDWSSDVCSSDLLHFWRHGNWSASNTRHVKPAFLPNVADDFAAQTLLIGVMTCHQTPGRRKNGYSQSTTDARDTSLLV